MGLKVFKGQEKEGDKDVYLKLVDLGYEIKVVACDINGVPKREGNLIAFTETGYLVRIRDVNKRLGFPLDRNGRIISTEE